jgi:hypothetical protein
MQFSNAITSVSELINQPLAGDTLTVTLTSVKRNLNRGYKKVVNRVASLNQDYYLRLAKANLVANRSVYALPSDFKSIRRLDVTFNGSTMVRGERIDRQTINDPMLVVSEVTPLYSLISNGVELYPTPLANVTAGLWLWYIEDVSDLVEDTDIPNVPLGYEDLCIDYAVAMAKMTQGETDEGAMYLGMFDKALSEMTMEQVSRASDNNDYVIMRDGIDY